MAERFVDILDDEGSVIGAAGVEEAHANGLLHRSVHVLVVDALGRVFVRQRPGDKPMYAGLWTSSVGTHLIKGDTPEATALGGLKYFLGVEDVPVTLVGEGRVHDDYENEIITVFRCQADNVPALNPNEGMDGAFMTNSEIQNLVAEAKTTPHLSTAVMLLAEQG